MLTLKDIAGHPALHRCVQTQALALLAAFRADPRRSAVFATQQRWLMAHVGLAMHFRREPGDYRKELTASRFLDVIGRHAVASRNTADAFVREMLHYNFIESVENSEDRRIRPLRPTAASLESVTGWLLAHLQTLDGLDGAGRIANFVQQPGALARVQPLVADGLLSSNPVREPKQTFSLFTWLNNGGAVMDWLISSVDPDQAGLDHIPTGVTSTGDLTNWLTLSRTHLARKLRDAESLGSLGWMGLRGHSVMWISNSFYQEYMSAQAVKLAIIDSAYAQSFPA